MRAGAVVAFLGIALILAGGALHASGSPIAGSFFYVFTWVGLLFLLDGANCAVSGESLLVSTPARFIGLYALSIPWWLAFELLNFRLELWNYRGLPGPGVVRWAGYALVFGALLPAVAEARQLLGTVFPLKDVTLPAFRITEGTRSSLLFAGLLSLFLVLLWPGVYFPLVWMAAFLIIEPHVSRAAPLESFLFDLSMGSAESFLGWAGGGLFCGAAWLAFNGWAGGCWVYAGRGLLGPALFGMPLSGYLGFAAFALGCASIAALSTVAWAQMGEKARFLTVFILAFFCAAVLTGMDRIAAQTFMP